MNLNLHQNVRITPAIGQGLRESTQAERELARKYHLNRATVRRWRRRDHGQDASHRPYRLRTTLTPAQELIVVALRKTLLLPLDDLLAVTREFLNPAASRSGLDRCLRRQGVSDHHALIPQPEADEQPTKTFKDDESWLRPHRCQVAAAAAGRRRPIAICSSASIAPHAKAPFQVQKVPTDNGNAFTNHFCATGERDPPPDVIALIAPAIPTASTTG
jgi:transposase-like protein